MTESQRARLVLDRISVYGGMIAAACECLGANSMTVPEFHDALVPAWRDTGEGELLGFLLESGVAEKRRGALRLSRHYRPEHSAKLNLLALLHSRTDVNYTFRFVWECLLERPEWAARFINRDDLWPVINQLHPAGAALAQLNSNRMASWIRLASWLGLIQPERSNTFCLVPTRDLVLDLLHATVAGTAAVPLVRVVAGLESRYCRITIRPDELHPGFASVLRLLEAEGVLTLHSHSDELTFRAGGRSVTHMTWGAVAG